MKTVGELRKDLDELPDDMPVHYQRIEDKYFEQYNWTGTRYVYEHYQGREPDISECVQVFNAGQRLLENSDERIFVLEAHY